MDNDMIQALLNISGENVMIDGRLGPNSRKAIKNFQKRHKIKVDGSAGPETRYELMFYKYPNFKKREFKCPKSCSGYPVRMDEKVIRLMQNIRNHFGSPITVTSGMRCKTHNKNVGGIKNSEHLKGKAVDFKVRGVSPRKVQDYAYSLNQIGGTGYYNTFTHVDVKGDKFKFNGGY